MEENLKKQIEQNEQDIETMKKTYEQKLAEALAKVIYFFSSKHADIIILICKFITDSRNKQKK